MKRLETQVEGLQKQLDSFSGELEKLGVGYKALAQDYRRIADALPEA